MKKSLVRPANDRILGGVCAAIAARLRVNVLVVRAAFLVLALANGMGVALYGAMWIVVPPEKSDRRFAATDRRRRRIKQMESVVGQAWESMQRSDQGRSIALALVCIGAFVLLGSFGIFQWLDPMRVVAIVGIGIGGAALLSLPNETGRR